MRQYVNQHRDTGASLIDVVVGIVLAAMVITIGVGIMRQVSTTDRDVVGSYQIQRELQDTQSVLYRDVVDGISLRIAEPRELAFTVFRDGTCRVRHFYVEGGALMLTEEFYEGQECFGPFETRTEKLLSNIQEGRIFGYEDEKQRAISEVNHFPGVRLITWDLEPVVETTGRVMPISSGAAFDHVPEGRGTGVQHEQAKAPYLKVVTPVVGVDNPQLAWVDSTPDLTLQWVIWRTTGPEGEPAGSREPVGRVEAGTTTWTDPDLPAGSTAVYSVQAVLNNGQQAPPSNAVVTGMRPAVPTVTATGQAQAIKLDWTPVSGATGYDIYRDGVLVANADNVTTWTDSVGYGHSHAYTVVATNRWEQRWTTGTDNGRVAVGTPATRTFAGGHARLHSTARGAFTAPAAPSITATPNTNASATVTRTFAGWTGAGPTGARNRGWELQRAPLSGSFAAVGGEHTTTSYTHTGRTLGATDRYRARACNTSGCGPWSGTASALQRPPAPTCTVDQITTRSQRVTINRPTIESAYSQYDVVSNRAGGTNLGVSTSYRRTVDKLTHNVSHTYTVRTRNASPANGGWSDTRTCSASTARLAVALGKITTTTRGITIAGANSSGGASWTGGDTRRLTIEKGSGSGLTIYREWASFNQDRSYNKLTHNTTYRVKATNTDGHNTVSAQQNVRTDLLAVSLGSIQRETNSLTIVGRANGGADWTNGDTRSLVVRRGSTTVRSWSSFNQDRTVSGLTHGTTYTVTATNSDGHNTVEATRERTTLTLTAPAASCSASVQTSTAPGSIRVSGGTQVRLSSGATTYAGPRTYTGLSAGTYRPQARNRATDGTNTVYSGWSSCPARTIGVGIPDRPMITYVSRGQRLVARWSAPTGAIEYQYRFDQWSSGFGQWSSGTVHTTTGTQATSTFNPSSERYRFAIRARGASGWSAWRFEEFPW